MKNKMENIKVSHLNKTYKNGVTAIDDLSLQVKQGEVFTLLGKNGAGKSTLINILTTFLSATSGEITMFGMDLKTHTSEIRRKICCVAQKPSIDQYLSLKENLLFQARLYGIPLEEAKNRMKRLMECFELERYAKMPVSAYSGGVKRRLDIAVSMMSNPQIIFLDEPTVGMDIQSRMAMWEMINKIKKEFGTTIFLTTHYLKEADVLSDTICIIKDGKNVIQGTAPELRKYINQEMIEIALAGKEDIKRCRNMLDEMYISEKVFENEDNGCRIRYKGSLDEMHQLIKRFMENGILFQGIQMVQPSMEDIFLQFTSENKGDDGKCN